jgi:hypothetical protein
MVNEQTRKMSISGTYELWIPILVLVLLVAFLIYMGNFQDEYANGVIPQYNRMKGLGLALHHYKEKVGTFPPDIVSKSSGEKLLSWRVVVCEEMELAELLPDYEDSEKWNSPNNINLTNYLPYIYSYTRKNDSDNCDDQQQQGMSDIIGVKNQNGGWNGEGSDHNSVLYLNGKVVICVGVSEPDKVPWTKPLDYSQSELIEKLKQDEKSSSKSILCALFDNGAVDKAPFTWELRKSGRR